MKFLIDFFPALLFFIAYKLFNIYIATGVLIISSAIQIIFYWVWKKKWEPMHWITFLFVLIFGGLTIYFHDPAFLKWKVSIVNWLFGLAFILSGFFSKRSLIEILMSSANTHNTAIPSSIFKTLNTLWGYYFIGLGFLNLIIILTCSTAIWVDFKVFGMAGLSIVFVLIQSIYLIKKLKNKS